MSATQLEVVDGPDKPSLQWAVAYPERERVHFRGEHDGFDAEIASMEELSDGFSFRLSGLVRSGEHQGRAFTGVYSVEQRAGRLEIDGA